MQTIKNYILNLDFVKEHIANEIRDVSIENSYQAVEITQSIKDAAEKQVSELLGTVDEKEIIMIDEKRGFVFVGGERITPELALNMKQEAEMIKGTYLWKLMTTTIEASAQKRIFKDSEKPEHILAGKMALYNLSLFKKILTMFSNYVAR